ncbi:unnamed protein product [Brassica oleracea var. botrytis]|uniref:(rape) hypothetical protein n=1 Tax=Brassica napus TaxID=3708 RepID=A0A816KKT2_BRANA|nr:unnamed protein product [Brassica napus]
MFMFLLQQDKNAIEKKAPPLIKKKKTGASFSPPKVPGALLLQNLDLTDTRSPVNLPSKSWLQRFCMQMSDVSHEAIRFRVGWSIFCFIDVKYLIIIYVRECRIM